MIILHILNLCWVARKLPISWTRSELISVLKEGNTSPQEIYRACRLPSAGTTVRTTLNGHYRGH
jgi:hypothetical protein